MQSANIFIVEDNESFLRGLSITLSKAGHTVALEAEDMDSAIMFIEQGYMETENINVVVLDGNLTPDDVSCNDGKTIARMIRKVKPGMKIIACSSCDAKTADYGDVHCDGSIDTVLSIIAEL